MDYCYKYPKPSITVDIMLFVKSSNGIEVLLIQRKNPPFQQFFALPGGFIEMDEKLMAAAVRELKEETNIDVNSLSEFGIYDDVNRDPRGRTLSVIYYAILDKKPSNLKAGDDAQHAKWFPLTMLPELAFDHTDILEDSRRLFN